jgi:hypothetical protein
MEKAQSAMEFLITYGWAILVIAIALGALYVLGVFNPSNFTANMCVFPGEKFACNGYAILVDGNVMINLQQLTGQSINITAVGCNSDGDSFNMVQYTPQINLPIDGNATFNVQCYTDGNAITPAIGTIYNGYVVVNYTDLTSGFPEQTSGTLTVKVT